MRVPLFVAAPIKTVCGLFDFSVLFERRATLQRLKFGLQCQPDISKCVSPGSPYVCNDEVQSKFQSSFNRVCGGVDVVFSPPVTGKSTYLKQDAQRQAEKNTHNIRYISGGVKDRTELYKALGIEPWWLPLSSVFSPVKVFGLTIGRPKTVLVLDHQEQACEFDHYQKGLFLMLATDSMLCHNYRTIVIVSDLERAESIVRLNGGCKFYKLGTATMFKWRSAHIHKFVEGSEVLRELPQETKEEIVKLGIEAGSCGYMNELRVYFSQEGKGSCAVPKRMYIRAKEQSDRWREAAKWDE